MVCGMFLCGGPCEACSSVADRVRHVLVWRTMCEACSCVADHVRHVLVWRTVCEAFSSVADCV